MRGYDRMGCCRRARQIAEGVAMAVSGRKCASTDARMRACRLCPDNDWWGKQLACRHCWCVIYLKARVHDATCPLGRWPDGDGGFKGGDIRAGVSADHSKMKPAVAPPSQKPTGIDRPGLPGAEVVGQ